MAKSTYYDLVLQTGIPQGSDVLNKPCQIVFNFPNGSQSGPYGQTTLLAWFTSNLVRVKSSFMNLQTVSQGFINGTLMIDTGKGNLNYTFVNFAVAPKLSTSQT